MRYGTSLAYKVDLWYQQEIRFLRGYYPYHAHKFVANQITSKLMYIAQGLAII